MALFSVIESLKWNQSPGSLEPPGTRPDCWWATVQAGGTRQPGSSPETVCNSSTTTTIWLEELLSPLTQTFWKRCCPCTLLSDSWTYENNAKSRFIWAKCRQSGCDEFWWIIGLEVQDVLSARSTSAAPQALILFCLHSLYLLAGLSLIMSYFEEVFILLGYQPS